MSKTVTPNTLVAEAENAGSRADRRLRSRAAILAAARSLFGERGFERTTIRAVAARAEVDPALVMQHFGSKAALFDAASDIGLGLADVVDGPIEELGDRAVRHVFGQVEAAPEATLSMLRSMLTHTRAAEAVRCAFTPEDAPPPLAQALTGNETELRAGLVGSVLIGLLVGRFLLRFPPVDTASVDRVVALLNPALAALIVESPEGRPGRQAGRPVVEASGPADVVGQADVAGPADVTGRARVGAVVGGAGAAGREAGDPLDALARAEAERRRADAALDDAARAALARGATYGEVGRVLGMSRQAARQRWGRAAVDRADDN
ncbi:TetR/AcrR family transcriptional regulator [Pseudofrankia inefficax]|uniref:TetR/AcrR family transcriptional regulator n=1 Tax=Pseudofrankia inefficax (strain DSM 45817 / CECT 9037 / DDB 130130 / EuI1c) TaxID=298654 RepID=UPI0018DF9EB0|nr:TetR/AcrR family transcriptional regulator [Pseudofrankia inefficax]